MLETISAALTSPAFAGGAGAVGATLLYVTVPVVWDWVDTKVKAARAALAGVAGAEITKLKADIQPTLAAIVADIVAPLEARVAAVETALAATRVAASGVVAAAVHAPAQAVAPSTPILGGVGK